MVGFRVKLFNAMLLQTSVAKAERKFLPRSESKVLGAPCRKIISSNKSFAIAAALILLTAKIFDYLVRYSVKTTRHLFPEHVTGSGPKRSTANGLKAPSAGIGTSGARPRPRSAVYAFSDSVFHCLIFHKSCINLNVPQINHHEHELRPHGVMA